LAILPGASVIGLDLENHAKPPQPIVPVDCSICSPGALRSVFEPKGYWFLVVPGENSRQGGATSAPTIVLLPFSWEELLERVLDLVSPSKSKVLERFIVFGDVCVDLARMEVIREGRKVALTAQEFNTLRFLVLNPDRVISRDELLNQAWGYERYPVTRTVDNHILKLRQKLEKDPAHPVHFRTVHRMGYKFVGVSDLVRAVAPRDETRKSSDQC